MINIAHDQRRGLSVPFYLENQYEFSFSSNGKQNIFIFSIFDISYFSPFSDVKLSTFLFLCIIFVPASVYFNKSIYQLRPQLKLESLTVVIKFVWPFVAYVTHNLMQSNADIFTVRVCIRYYTSSTLHYMQWHFA